jgi:hypothetical protein
MCPGDLIRPKFNQAVCLWRDVKQNRDTMRWSMRNKVGHLTDVAMVVAFPNFPGCGKDGPKSSAVLLLTTDNRLLWAWGSSLMVV